MSMILGYDRVSTKDQNLDGQRDALGAAGGERIFADTMTGATWSRTELDRLMAELRHGEVVVFTKFDRTTRVSERWNRANGRSDQTVGRNASWRCWNGGFQACRLAAWNDVGRQLLAVTRH